MIFADTEMTKINVYHNGQLVVTMDDEGVSCAKGYDITAVVPQEVQLNVQKKDNGDSEATC